MTTLDDDDSKQHDGLRRRITVDRSTSSFDRFRDLDLWTRHFENLVSKSSDYSKYLGKFLFTSLQRFRSYQVHKISIAVAAFDPMTLKIFSTITHMMVICDKFHWSLSTKYRDTASREVGDNGQRTPGRRNWKHDTLRLLLLAAEAWRLTGLSQ